MPAKTLMKLFPLLPLIINLSFTIMLTSSSLTNNKVTIWLVILKANNHLQISTYILYNNLIFHGSQLTKNQKRIKSFV